MRMCAIDRPSRHQVARADSLRCPDIAHHEIALYLRESARTQVCEDAPPRFQNLLLIPLVIIVGRRIRHHEERFTFPRHDRAITAARHIDIDRRHGWKPPLIEQLSKLTLIIAGKVDGMMMKFRDRPLDAQQKDQSRERTLLMCQSLLRGLTRQPRSEHRPNSRSIAIHDHHVSLYSPAALEPRSQITRRSLPP